jgi:hypothetical protein
VVVIVRADPSIANVGRLANLLLTMERCATLAIGSVVVLLLLSRLPSVLLAALVMALALEPTTAPNLSETDMPLPPGALVRAVSPANLVMMDLAPLVQNVRQLPQRRTTSGATACGQMLLFGPKHTPERAARPLHPQLLLTPPSLLVVGPSLT